MSFGEPFDKPTSLKLWPGEVFKRSDRNSESSFVEVKQNFIEKQKLILQYPIDLVGLLDDALQIL